MDDFLEEKGNITMSGQMETMKELTKKTLEFDLDGVARNIDQVKKEDVDSSLYMGN